MFGQLATASRVTILVGAIIVALLLSAEMTTFRTQSLLLASFAEKLAFRVAPGANDKLVYPDGGVYDKRLGYSTLPGMIEKLHRAGYTVDAQARWSRALQNVASHGLYIPYDRKHQAGLEIVDQEARPLSVSDYPRRAYRDFDEIPPLVVATLLFIENRELLDANHPARNPAVEWDRLALSLGNQVLSLVGTVGKTPGASTLATQLEKYHHSPGGLTTSPAEKLRQMLSASLRAYKDGPDTTAARRRLVTEYLNTVPLSAAPAIGEIHGVGDGLWAWFGADFDTVNELLRRPDSQEAARAYRHLLSLLLAQRRPSDFLLSHRSALAELTDRYLQLLADKRIISGSLLEHAEGLVLTWRSDDPPERSSFIERKWPYYVRGELAGLLGVPSFYDLDRLDLRASTTIHAGMQHAAEDLLARLTDPAQTDALGAAVD